MVDLIKIYFNHVDFIRVSQIVSFVVGLQKIGKVHLIQVVALSIRF